MQSQSLYYSKLIILNCGFGFQLQNVSESIKKKKMLLCKSFMSLYKKRTIWNYFYSPFKREAYLQE